MQSTRGLENKQTGGFSLVEVMVALALCVLVLPVAMTLLSTNLGRINENEAKLSNAAVAACILETMAAERQLDLDIPIAKQSQYGQTYLSISEHKLSNEIPYLEHSVKPSAASTMNVVAKYCLPPEINLNYQAQTNSNTSVWQGKLPTVEALKECAYSFEELQK